MTTEEVDYVETIADGRERTPEEKLQAADLANRVLSSLEPMDRIAMTLVYTEDRSLDDVSRSLDITVSNLKHGYSDAVTRSRNATHTFSKSSYVWSSALRASHCSRVSSSALLLAGAPISWSPSEDPG